MLPVAPWEAALGATVSVPTLGGPVELKIPADSEAGRKLRLRGRGLPGCHGMQPPGDQIVELEVLAPRVHNDSAAGGLSDDARRASATIGAVPEALAASTTRRQQTRQAASGCEQVRPASAWMMSASSVSLNGLVM